MLQENASLPPAARLSVKAIYERICDEEGFRGSYTAVTDYARPIAASDECIWEYAYDLLVSLEKKRAINFLYLLSRADPPVISPKRIEQFFRDAGRVIRVTPKPDKRAQARQAAFEWMRAVLQKDISLDALRRTVGDVLNVTTLLQRLYDGCLSDRNRSMVILASCHGLSSGIVCSFIGIDKRYVYVWADGVYLQARMEDNAECMRRTTKTDHGRFVGQDGGGSAALASRLSLGITAPCRGYTLHLLGHSSIVMTLDRYGHLFPRGDDRAELAAAARCCWRTRNGLLGLFGKNKTSKALLAQRFAPAPIKKGRHLQFTTISLGGLLGRLFFLFGTLPQLL